MLVLTRSIGDCIMIGPDIVITVTAVKGNTVRIGVAAPKNVKVLRTELVDVPRQGPVSAE